jgi:hypothetical protein
LLKNILCQGKDLREIATELLPISKDALTGAGVVTNLAIVYAWTDELDLAFATLEHAAKTPACISYGELKRTSTGSRFGKTLDMKSF